jgi:hypothetical protein
MFDVFHGFGRSFLELLVDTDSPQLKAEIQNTHWMALRYNSPNIQHGNKHLMRPAEAGLLKNLLKRLEEGIVVVRTRIDKENDRRKAGKKRVALPCLALPCFALPCLALPCDRSVIFLQYSLLIALKSLCNRCTIAMRLCDCSVIVLQSLCNHSAIALQSPSDRYANALQSLCDCIAIAKRLKNNHRTIVQSHSDSTAIAKRLQIDRIAIAERFQSD